MRLHRDTCHLPRGQNGKTLSLPLLPVTTRGECADREQKQLTFSRNQRTRTTDRMITCCNV